MTDWIILTLISLVSSGFAVWWLRPRRSLRSRPFGTALAQPASDKVYLFDGCRLVGHSDAAAAGMEDIVDWDGLRKRLQWDFPAYPETPDIVREKGSVVVPAIDSTIQRTILCEWIDGITRVQMRDLDAGPAPRRAQDTESNPMRLAMDKAPYPVWLLNRSGKLGWCNAAYVSLVRKVGGEDASLTDPLVGPAAGEGQSGSRTRIGIDTRDPGRKLWFDLTQVTLGEDTLCYAVDVDAIVEAEIAQRKFVQTLAKTFAQLSTGLAIFDRNRQLALFNPALVDLTALPADFLSCRPSLSGFFDRLRDQNMMPEPKNYTGWRKQMNDLLEAAEEGNYHETWSLPSGSVYSVSGRPHPDGAVAFLFEDITAEITLTRRFRSELELLQTALDKLPDAIAVFSADGTLALTNSAYHQLWQTEAEAGFDQVTVLGATRDWQERCTATPVWGEIRDFVEMRDNRAEWSAQIRLRRGSNLTCTVSPIQSSATMVRFRAETETETENVRSPTTEPLQA